MRPFDKACILVLDGAGIGAAPDCAAFGDPDIVNTLGNCAKAVGGLRAPRLQRMGLGNLCTIEGVAPNQRPDAFALRMVETSAGKDTPTGHWEMVGVHTTQPFAVFNPRFPDDIVERFEQESGYRVLGNCVASGTAILDELGPEHLRTGKPILYTSADSVFQIAAHEEVIDVHALWRMCEVARRVLDPWRVGRVIARPFVGQPGAWRRTYNRKDFSMPPPPNTLLDRMVAAGLRVVGVGKIQDIFAGCGVPESLHTEGNADGLAQTIAACRSLGQGLVFTNLVDFDALYGHRRDPLGFARALTEADDQLDHLLDALGDRGLLCITADHGNDPTYLGSTDHTREVVPLLLASRRFSAGADLGTGESFACLGQTLAENFGLGDLGLGRSYLSCLTA
ncbi:MAG: phosphopentomutase [Deltaproteobacteria bacterium]|nr:phosphopentomutase [Deltaproteobacteria bacterium]